MTVPQRVQNGVQAEKSLFDIDLVTRSLWRGNTVYPRAAHVRLLFQGNCILEAPLLDRGSGEPLHVAAADAWPFTVRLTRSGFCFEGKALPEPEWPANGCGGLFYARNGFTCLPYRAPGILAVAVAAAPAVLAAMAFDPEPLPVERPGGLPGDEWRFETPAAALEGLFCAVPLAPQAAWLPPADALPVFDRAFRLAVELMRLPAWERWAVRGEPDHFLVLGARTEQGWRLAVLTVARGKPAVICLRFEDLIRALPMSGPTVSVDVAFEGDGIEAERITSAGWDTRLRVPVADNGGVVVTLTAHGTERS